MGLDCSHGAFHGAYSAFNRFRQAVASAAGGSYPPHDNDALDQNRWYAGNWKNPERPGLTEFFNHSDCDGKIAPALCAVIADEIEALLPEIARQAPRFDGGHIDREGGMYQVAKNFIAGCREAASLAEPLTFG